MQRLGLALILASTTLCAQGDQLPVVAPVLGTAPLYNYEDAPTTPDADDPVIWVSRDHARNALVIGTVKDAGLVVYDLAGQLVQAIRPPNAPQVLPEDPPSPAGVNPALDNPCVESEEGDTFGRFNNVDVAYGVRLGVGRADVAIVSDRGCDRVRFYKIDPSDPEGPLVDITAPDVPRVFPTRYDQPSLIQPSGASEGWTDNPLDDQNTVYGLTVAPGRSDQLFVTERERGLVRQLTIVPTADGKLSYSVKRTFLFDTSYALKDKLANEYAWTPCREAPEEEPQSEGLVFDRVNETLYVAFETVGLYKVPLDSPTDFVRLGVDKLIEPVKSFGRAYRATPNDDEFECEYDPAGDPAPADIVASGSAKNAGRFLEADLEGLNIITSVPGQTLLLASSQGDSSFHFYQISTKKIRHLGAFTIDGVGETDGVHYAPDPIDRQYPLGLLVAQNGEAPEPPNTDPINGFPFDGATQFIYVNFLDVLKTLPR